MVLLLAFILQDYQPEPQAPNPKSALWKAVHLSFMTMTKHGRLFEGLSLDSAGSAMQVFGSALPVFP